MIHQKKFQRRRNRDGTHDSIVWTVLRQSQQLNEKQTSIRTNQLTSANQSTGSFKADSPALPIRLGPRSLHSSKRGRIVSAFCAQLLTGTRWPHGSGGRGITWGLQMGGCITCGGYAGLVIRGSYRGSLRISEEPVGRTSRKVAFSASWG